MRAVCWQRPGAVRVETVADPEIVGPRDALVRVTCAAIDGTDLAIAAGLVPTLRRGDVLGRQFVGEVVAVGSALAAPRTGERVVVTAAISCGRCPPCRADLFALCDNSNPNAWMAEERFGQSPAGVFGAAHLFGAHAGGQAERVRVPFADLNARPLPAGLDDELALLLADAVPAGWQAAADADLAPGDVVAVWGCGPVGIVAVRAAALLGAERVVAIDRHAGRLRLASEAGAETLDPTAVDDPVEALRERCGGRGPDRCVVAAPADGYDVLDAAGGGRRPWGCDDAEPPLALAIRACAKGGTVSIPGLVTQLPAHAPLAAAHAKGLTLRFGRTHARRWLEPLLERLARGELDPRALLTHRLPLAEAPAGYALLRDRPDAALAVALSP